MIPDLSICIVTLNTRVYLQACLRSLYQQTSELNFEVIVVDNASTDGLVEMLSQEFPEVMVIQNSANLGYTAPMNQALRAARGRYLAQLNPDTLVGEAAFNRLVAYMDANQQVGICGPKVINPDGSLQKSCRRGESRPLAVIGYMSGLDRLFPENRALNQYHLTYLPEDETHAVDGVAGSCMVIRRELVDQIGYLDEVYFAYQEDADLCFRARQAGWQVVYHPEAQITHFGGQGGSRYQPWRAIYEWHRSYWVYYQKNLAKDYPAWLNFFYYLLIAGKMGLAFFLNLFRRERFAGPKRQVLSDSIADKPV
jgi:hypothetical protein